MAYRVGLPFWRALARRGVPLSVRIDVERDDEAGVFIATSNDLRGLAVEAASFDEILNEAKGAIGALLETEMHGHDHHHGNDPAVVQRFRYRDKSVTTA